MPMASAMIGESRHLPLHLRQECHLEDWNPLVHRTLAVPFLLRGVHPRPHRHHERVAKKFRPSFPPVRRSHRQGLLRGRHHHAQPTNSGHRRHSQTLANSRKCQLQAFRSGIELSRMSQILVHLHLPGLQKRLSKTKRMQDQSSASHHLFKEKESRRRPLHRRQVGLPYSLPHVILERPVTVMPYRLARSPPLLYLPKA